MTIYDMQKNPDLLKDMEMNHILTIIKESITDKNLNIISDVMKNPVIKRYIQYLIRMQVNVESITEPDYQNLYLIIHILQSIYNYSGEDTTVSDYDYDRLYELMEGYGTELISTPILNKDNVIHHNYPTLRGTLSKIYILEEGETSANKSRGSLQDWIRRCEKIYLDKTGEKINLSETEIYVFPKWDGVSVVFEFDENNNMIHAIPRGDTETNESRDVRFIFSSIVSRIRDVNMTGKAYGLKTEVMMRESDVELYNKKFKKEYKTTRSIVSSIINSDTLDGRENLLEVVRLRTSTLNSDGTETLQELATNVFERPFIRCRLKDTEAIRKFAYKHRSIYGLNCDGAVIYIIDEKIRKILGRKDNKNQYEVAFKFNEDIGYSKIKNIKFNLTIFGRLFPVAEFEPIKMKGVTVSEVSLGSISRFYKLQLRVGDTVKILYEIIPYLVMDEDDPNCKRSKNPIITPPEFCPECGDMLEHNANRTILTCINPKCPCRARGKILNYVQKMGIREIGESKVNDLYKYGFLKKITDLYTLKSKYNELIQLPGYDTTSVNKMITEIDSHRKDIPASIFMGSIGIECVGRKTFEKIFSKYNIEELLEFSEDMKISKLITIEGIKDLTAKKILDGINENRKLIEKLLSKYITITYPEEKKGKFIAVFHKIRSVAITQLVESYGGIVEDNLTKRTTFLIVPNGFGNSSSSTSDKARKYGIPIVEIDDVEKFLKKMES